MYATRLVEIAALFSWHGKSISYVRQGLPLPALNAYWIANRQRTDQWNEAIYVYRSQLELVGSAKRIAVWSQLRRVISEVFLSDALTRMLAAIGAELERENIDEDASPITASVAASHAEVRQRCMKLMLEGPGQPTSDAVQLNRLRVHLEEWGDMLLGQLGDCHGSRLHCHNLERLLEWSQDGGSDYDTDTQSISTQLRFLGMRRWLTHHAFQGDANPNLNYTIGQSAVAMLRPEWFDSVGCLHSLAYHRLQSIISETDGMVASLLSTASLPPQTTETHDLLEQFRQAKLGDPFRR